MNVDWSVFKNFVNSKNLYIQGIESNGYYYLACYDDQFELTTSLFINASDNADVLDFETNYKPNWNKKINKTDRENTLYFKQMISESAMNFNPRCFDFTLGTYGSLCNKSSNGVDLGDAELLFLDNSRNFITKNEEETIEQFQNRLDTSCSHTWLYFTSKKRFGIKAGEILYKGNPSGEFDAWFEVAPHIPRESGGSIAFMDGGLPLDMYLPGIPITIDGATCSILELDLLNFTHRLGIKIQHEIGDKMSILGIFNIYV